VAKGLLTRRQLSRSTWRRLMSDVYVHADVPVDALTRCQAAALLLSPGGVLSHAAAVYIWTAALPPVAIEATVPAAATLRSTFGLVVRRAPLPTMDTARRGGLPTTSLLRAAFDVARHHPLVDAVVTIDHLLERRLITLDDLLAFAEERSRWVGVRQVRAVAALALPGAESPMETRSRLIIVQAGLPCPVLQYEVRDASGALIARLDMAYPELRIGIEYDGDHHRERATFRRDAARVNRLRLCGWTVLRFTADDVLRHPDRMAAQIRQAIVAAGG
jgi:hypothetical protein